MHPLLGANPLALLNAIYRLGALPTIHFLPKFVFVAAMSVLNVPFILFEALILLFSTKAEGSDPIFIIGHPRTGTTHLQQVLAEDPQFFTPRLKDVLFPNFTNTFAKVLASLLAPFLPATRPQDNVSLNLNAPQEEEFALASTSGISFINGFYFPKQFKKIIRQAVLFEDPKDKIRWQRSLKRFIRSIGVHGKNRRLILKSPANMARITAIMEIYPNAKFIHIEREAERTLQSTLHLFEKVVPHTSFQYIREDEMLDNAFYMYEVFHSAYLEQSKKLDDTQLITISHNAFVEDPQQELNRIYQFLEMDCRLSPEVIKNYRNYRKNQHKPLPENIKRRLQSIESRVAPIVPIRRSKKSLTRAEKVA